MATVTDGATTITPLLVLGYASKRESRNVVHQVIGRTGDDVTLRPASLRTGTLTMLFANEADALACEQMHAAGAVFTLVDDDLSSTTMLYILAGSLPRVLDDQTRRRWTVAVDFQEVQP